MHSSLQFKQCSKATFAVRHGFLLLDLFYLSSCHSSRFRICSILTFLSPYFEYCRNATSLLPFSFLQIPWDTSISRWTMHFLEPYTSELVPKSSARLWQLTKSRIPSPLSYDLFNRTSSALTWSCATWLRSPRDPLLSPTERNHNQVIWFSAFVHL